MPFSKIKPVLLSWQLYECSTHNNMSATLTVLHKSTPIHTSTFTNTVTQSYPSYTLMHVCLHTYTHTHTNVVTSENIKLTLPPLTSKTTRKIIMSPQKYCRFLGSHPQRTEASFETPTPVRQLCTHRADSQHHSTCRWF